MTIAAMLLAVAVAIPAGIVAAVHRGGWIDRLLMAGALAGQAVPIFWLGLILVRVFAVDLKILPVYGQGGLDHLAASYYTWATIILADLGEVGTLQSVGGAQPGSCADCARQGPAGTARVIAAWVAQCRDATDHRAWLANGAVAGRRGGHRK